MGLYAVFPRWIFPISSYYENIDFQHEIGAIYYGAPDMNANTGFFAEGYLRFGHIGTILNSSISGLVYFLSILNLHQAY